MYRQVYIGAPLLKVEVKFSFVIKPFINILLFFLDDNICIFAFVKGKYCKTQNDAAKIVPVQPEDDRTGHLLVAFPLQE